MSRKQIIFDQTRNPRVPLTSCPFLPLDSGSWFSRIARGLRAASLLPLFILLAFLLYLSADCVAQEMPESQAAFNFAVSNLLVSPPNISECSYVTKIDPTGAKSIHSLQNFFKVGCCQSNYYLIVFPDESAMGDCLNAREAHGSFGGTNWRAAGGILAMESLASEAASGSALGGDGWLRLAQTPLLLGCGGLRPGTVHFDSPIRFHAEDMASSTLVGALEAGEKTNESIIDYSVTNNGSPMTWQVVLEWPYPFTKEPFPSSIAVRLGGKTVSTTRILSMNYTRELLDESDFYPTNLAGCKLRILATGVQNGTNLVAFDSEGNKLRTLTSGDPRIVRPANRWARTLFLVVISLITICFICVALAAARRKSNKRPS